ncbi:related to DOA1 - involved in ubiquitin-dependent proteolysis [Ustilago trichophora]|uniref:Related to DOA1 - involved in ubiquitin-dependent proteolysis n=1 Tax=Ustilago trichophora TaxID=86804 RepID=A0A5C3EHR2_9BASI|nr:related to DOA1 - involved in ubiquitin-dependent proteolysis [Ustilago trichophora]
MEENEASEFSIVNEDSSSRDEPTGFQLTHVLRGHTSDVRSVATTLDNLSGREALLSGSRDQTATYWSRAPPRDSSSSSDFEKGATFQGKRFCNAVTFIQPSPAYGVPRGQILMGNLDSQIRCFDPLRADKPLQVLSEHWDNISVLQSYATTQGKDDEKDSLPVFISASWDKTARVWMWDPADGSGKWSCKFVLRGHDEAVWGVQIVEPPSAAALESGEKASAGKSKYLTSSADLFIRLFHGEQLHAVYAGHTDVVRSLLLLPTLPASGENAEESSPKHGELVLYPNEQLFASTSNDGTIRIWSLDLRRSPTPGNGGEALRILRGHTSLVYDVAAYLDHDTQAPRLVSSGEDGTFRVWNWVSGELLQTVAVPVISVWSIAVLPQSQDVAVGCSDSLVRVYSRHPPSNSTVDSNFSGPPLSTSEATIEAEKAQDVQERHQLAIQAKENPSVSGENAETGEHGEVFEGTRYDYVLRVDVSDDAEPLLLPINRGDDRKKVASDFVALHNLPESYVDKIVEFVNLVLG